MGVESQNSGEDRPSSEVEIKPPEFTLELQKPLGRLDRIKSLWKLTLFLLITVELGPAMVYVLGTNLLGHATWPLPPEFVLFLEVGSFGIVFGLTAVLAVGEERAFGDYGLPLRKAFGANFWVGFLLGLAEASVLVGLILLLGGYSFGRLVLQGAGILRWGFLHLAVFLFVGLYEEFAFRGYAQVSLTRVAGFWPAAISLSAAFGLVHLTNQGENWVGALSVALVGLLFAFTLRRSGNLWYAVGLHAGFDWGESFLYSVPNSGELLKGHLSSAVLQGPAWLTGGSVGPEGSVFCFLTLGLQFLVVMWLFPAKAKEPPTALASPQEPGQANASAT